MTAEKIAMALIRVGGGLALVATVLGIIVGGMWCWSRRVEVRRVE